MPDSIVPKIFWQRTFSDLAIVWIRFSLRGERFTASLLFHRNWEDHRHFPSQNLKPQKKGKRPINLCDNIGSKLIHSDEGSNTVIDYWLLPQNWPQRKRQKRYSMFGEVVQSLREFWKVMEFDFSIAPDSQMFNFETDRTGGNKCGRNNASPNGMASCLRWNLAWRYQLLIKCGPNYPCFHATATMCRSSNKLSWKPAMTFPELGRPRRWTSAQNFALTFVGIRFIFPSRSQQHPVLAAEPLNKQGIVSETCANIWLPGSQIQSRHLVNAHQRFRCLHRDNIKSWAFWRGESTITRDLPCVRNNNSVVTVTTRPRQSVGSFPQAQ
jgi:hypothetical protein